ncbi:hypothetical protein GCM10017708_22860 [Arthrobacter citreus]
MERAELESAGLVCRPEVCRLINGVEVPVSMVLRFPLSLRQHPHRAADSAEAVKRIRLRCCSKRGTVGPTPAI